MLPLIVRGRSMEPTVPDGSVVRADRSPLPLARGDVRVLWSPAAPRRRELKRIIGLPQERVAWDGRGTMWIDGQRLDEPYVRCGPSVPGDDEVQEILLGEEDYFVAGDNRLHSTDSRRYGPVRRAQLLERVGAHV